MRRQRFARRECLSQRVFVALIRQRQVNEIFESGGVQSQHAVQVSVDHGPGNYGSTPTDDGNIHATTRILVKLRGEARRSSSEQRYAERSYLVDVGAAAIDDDAGSAPYRCGQGNHLAYR